MISRLTGNLTLRPAGTEEPEFLTAEDILKTHARAYEPVSVQHMQALLGMLPILDFGTFMFIDLGSGKGRALFVAAMHPFQQVVGVEYSQELHEIAIRNMQTYRNPAQKCFDIRPTCADATTFNLPELPTVCFINNPFDVSLMARTAELFDESVQSAPRPFFIIYIHAYCSTYRRFARLVANTRGLLGEVVLCDLAVGRGQKR